MIKRYNMYNVKEMCVPCKEEEGVWVRWEEVVKYQAELENRKLEEWRDALINEQEF